LFLILIVIVVLVMGDSVGPGQAPNSYADLKSKADKNQYGR